MDKSESQTSLEPFILFEIAGTAYAVRSCDVQETEMVEHITPVPNAPPYVEGVVFLRGKVIPVINLRLRFGMERMPFNMQTRLVVVRHKDRTIGLIVDTCRRFTRIPTERIQPPPDVISESTKHYLQGFVMLDEKPVLVLDIGAVVNTTEIPQCEKSNSAQET
ncbi:MAG: chemotaxis protein CheW [Verrucomicrobiota bacterium]|nr:chemotaxis protein CheW [Verrucomicrobiota bacterium]